MAVLGARLAGVPSLMRNQMCQNGLSHPCTVSPPPHSEPLVDCTNALTCVGFPTQNQIKANHSKLRLLWIMENVNSESPSANIPNDTRAYNKIRGVTNKHNIHNNMIQRTNAKLKPSKTLTNPAISALQERCFRFEGIAATMCHNCFCYCCCRCFCCCCC